MTGFHREEAMNVHFNAPAKWALDLSFVLVLLAAVGAVVSIGALVTIPYAEVFIASLLIAAGLACALGYIVKV